MSRFLSLILLTLISQITFAQNQTPLTDTDSNIYEFFSGVLGKKVSVSVYKEDGRWVVDEHTIANDGLPDLVSKKTFRSEEQAYAYAKSLGATEQNKNPVALDLPAPEVLDLPGLVPTTTSLWKATNEWTWDWEIKFSQWVRANLHPLFFQELGIENDCADAYYQARMIFAKINKLPVSFRLSASGAWFTNNTMRSDWKNLKTNTDWKLDKRFLKALDYVAENTYTHTLGRDTYPIEISKEALIEGTAVLLYLSQESGHTLIVNEINLNNVDQKNKARLPMYTLNSTIPKGLQPLTESFFFSNEQPEKTTIGNTGFVRFRWPTAIGAKELVAAQKMPFYSEEQYSPDLLTSDPELPEDDPARSNFSLFVFKRLNPNFDPTLRITEGVSLLKELLKARIDLVDRGYQACKNGCDPLGETYDTWSTPSRDGRIKELINDLETYQSNLYSIPSVVEAWSKGLEGPVVSLTSNSYPLKLVKWVWQNDLFSSDPNKAPEVRWGLDPEAFAKISYETILPQLLARKEKMAQAPSCTNCGLFSPDFMMSSTYLEDADINTAVELRSQYCLNASQELCTKFEDTLAKFSTVTTAQKNFLETWQNISTLNSDSRVPEEARWGKILNFPNKVELTGAWSPLQNTSKDGLLLFAKTDYTVSQISMVDTKTQSVLFTQDFLGSIVWNIDQETSQITGLNTDKQELSLINPLTGDEMQKMKFTLGADDYAYEVTWLTEDSFVLKTYNTLMFSEKMQNGQFSDFNVVNGSYTILDKKTAIAVDKNAVTILDLTTKAIEQILIPAKLYNGFVPSYISIDTASTKNTRVVSWGFYDSNTSTSIDGKLLVNLQTGAVSSLDTKKFPNTIADGLTYIGDETKTTFFFVDDNLNVVKKIELSGACNNCYSIDKYIQIGQTVYTVDKTAQTFDPLVSMSDGFSMSSIVNDLMILSYYDANSSASNSALVSLKDGKVLLLSPSLEWLQPYIQGTSDFAPFLHASYYINKVINPGTDKEEYLYYNFNSILDPLNLSQGSISTTAPYYGNEGEDGEDGDFEPASGIMAGLLPLSASTIGKADFETLQMKNPTVTLLGKTPSVTKKPLKLLNIGDKKTLLIFDQP